MDRLGQWTLHLETLNHYLAVFPVAGHTNCVKSFYLYIAGNNKS